MVRIFHNIVTILANLTTLCNNIVIIYGYNVVEINNMVNNTVAILFTILSKSNILFTVLLQYLDHIMRNLEKVC